MASADTPLVDLEEEVIPGSKPGPRNLRVSKNQNPLNEKPKEATPSYKQGVIQKGFEDLYATIGTFVSLADPVCGPALVQCGPKAAAALEELAKTDPNVRRILLKFIGTSAWGKVIAAHVPLGMALFMHHGMGKIQHAHEERKQQREESGNSAAPGEWEYSDRSKDPNFSHFDDSGSVVPNDGNGFTYESPSAPTPGFVYTMPPNPALVGG